MTSRSRYTLPLQPFGHVLAGLAVGLFVESLATFLAHNDASTVAKRVRPRTEHTVVDESVEPIDQLRRE